MSLLIGAVLLTGAVVFYVLQPVLSGLEAPMEADDEEPTDAEAKRRVALLALRDVEYDMETGKLDEEDYAALRRDLSAEAIAALDVEEAEKRAAAGAGVDALDAGDVEADIARVRAGLRDGRTCARCGHVNPEGSQFCSICGVGVGASEPA